jgi:hypothetical protein
MLGAMYISAISSAYKSLYLGALLTRHLCGRFLGALAAVLAVHSQQAQIAAGKNVGHFPALDLANSGLGDLCAVCDLSLSEARLLKGKNNVSWFHSIIPFRLF